MEFRLSNYEAQLNEWFEPNLKYEGSGSADFSSPAGSVVGPFTVTYDEYGATLVETVYDFISYDPDYEAGPLGFLTGAKPETKNKVTTWGIGGSENICTKLEFCTQDGKYTSTSQVHLAGFNSVAGEKLRIRFYVPEARFDTGNSNTPKYFVLPLFNFVADKGYQIYGDHPLRIYRSPQVAEDLPEKEKLIANMKSNEKNDVLGFFLNGSVSFVECLPDFDERLASLRSGAQRRFTAVLVGEVGTNPVSDMAEFRSWFPMEVLSALGFASGVEVGFGWVEIRDESGALISRLHGHPWLPTYYEGDILFRDFDVTMPNGSGLGDVLTRFLKLPLSTRSFLEVVMNHARLGSLGSHLRLYDVLDHLIRAFECLCREYGFIQQNLLPALSTAYQQQVRNVLAGATSSIGALAKSAQAAGHFADARVLATIQSKASNASNTEKKFGLAVVDLLKNFALPDADVIDAFMAANPRVDGLPDWASVITSYRGATIHEGYLDFDNKHDPSDVVRVCAHLKDVLSRVVLTIVGYQGTYEPVVIRGFSPQNVDWVTATTHASRLGFEP